MNRNVQKYIPFSMVMVIVLALLVSLFFGSLFLSPEVKGDLFNPPYVSASFVSPADGSSVAVGATFTVVVKIKVNGPGDPVGVCPNLTHTPTATITELSGPDPSCPVVLDIGEEQEFSYTYKCNSGSPVNLTICPQVILLVRQSYNIVPCGINIPALSDILRKTTLPLFPQDHITCATIIINPDEPPPPENFARTLFNEGGGNITDWPKPADNRVINIYTQPRQAAANQPVTIYANMANRGEVDGAYTATLKINGQEEATKSGIVQANTAVPLKFTIYKDRPGTYQVDVNGQKTFFTIVGEEVKQGPFSGNSKLLAVILWGILVIAVITALTIVLLRRKQSYY